MLNARNAVQTVLVAAGLCVAGLAIAGVGRTSEPGSTSELHTSCLDGFIVADTKMLATGSGGVTTIILNPGSSIRLYDIASPIEYGTTDQEKIEAALKHSPDCIGIFENTARQGASVVLTVNIPFKKGLFAYQSGAAVTIQHR